MVSVDVERIWNGYMIDSSYFGKKYRATQAQALAEAKRILEVSVKEMYNEK